MWLLYQGVHGNGLQPSLANERSLPELRGGQTAEEQKMRRAEEHCVFLVCVWRSVLQEVPCCWWRRCSTRTARARSLCSSTLWTCWFRRRAGRGRPLSTPPCWLPPASPTSSTASLGRSTTPCWGTKRHSLSSTKLANCSDKKCLVKFLFLFGFFFLSFFHRNNWVIGGPLKATTLQPRQPHPNWHKIPRKKKYSFILEFCCTHKFNSQEKLYWWIALMNFLLRKNVPLNIFLPLHCSQSLSICLLCTSWCFSCLLLKCRIKIYWVKNSIRQCIYWLY